jgi:hypothetical protein
MQGSVESIKLPDFDDTSSNDRNTDENFFIAKTLDSESEDESDTVSIYEIRNQEKSKLIF